MPLVALVRPEAAQPVPGLGVCLGLSLQTLGLCCELLLVAWAWNGSQMQAWNHPTPHLPRCQLGVASLQLGGRSPDGGRAACLFRLMACPAQAWGGHSHPLPLVACLTLGKGLSL